MSGPDTVTVQMQKDTDLTAFASFPALTVQLPSNHSELQDMVTYSNKMPCNLQAFMKLFKPLLSALGKPSPFA